MTMEAITKGTIMEAGIIREATISRGTIRATWEEGTQDIRQTT
jgi:hypothetical protein